MLINAHELVNLFMLKNILAQMERKLAVIIELIPDKLTTKFLKSQNLFYIVIHVLIDCRFYKLILYSS